MTASFQTSDYDLVIIGAGPIGILLALLTQDRLSLFETPGRIAVIERSSIGSLQEPYRDGRTFALTNQTVCLLEELCLWDRIKEYACPIEHILVNEGGEQEGVHFSKALLDKTFGYIIESECFKNILLERFLETKTVDFFSDHDLEKIVSEPFWVKLCFSNGTTLKSRLIIGADGRKSGVRKLLYLPARGLFYDQGALVCHFSHQHAHRGWAIESFFPGGPFATLPMLGTSKHPHLSGVVWFDAPQRIKELQTMDEPLFAEALCEKIDKYRFGAIECVSPRWVYPVQGLVMPHIVGPRSVLVGDAAHVLHPVAGLGLNLGIRDIEILSLMLSFCLSLGLDPGSVEILQRYQRLRRLDVGIYLGITHVLVELFKSPKSETLFVRQEGLRVIDKLPILKKWIMEKGIGKESDYGLVLERSALREAQNQKAA